MSNRIRTKKIEVYLSDDEKDILETKFRLSNMNNKSAFIRKLILCGFVYDVDYSYLRNINTELGRIANNLNQISKRVNSTNNMYIDDMQEVQEMMNEIWQLQRSMLLKQPLINQ